MSEDDMVIEEPQTMVEPVEIIREAHTELDNMEVDLLGVQKTHVERVSEAGVATEGSFHSVQEIVTHDEPTREIPKDSDNMEDIELAGNTNSSPITLQQVEAHRVSIEPVMEGAMSVALEDNKDSLLEEDGKLNIVPSPSEGSSPVKPLVRKSSLTFASLPAREPLTTKKSIGARVSRTSHLDQTKPAPVTHNSYFGRYTSGKSLGATRLREQAEEPKEIDHMDVDKVHSSNTPLEESDCDGTMAMLHNKSSTQRLHERINLLGQKQHTRPTKSAAPNLLSTQPAYPELPIFDQDEISSGDQADQKVFPLKAVVLVDDDDEWIKPPLQQAELHDELQMAKSHPVDIMEQIGKKDGGNGRVIEVNSNNNKTQQLSSLASLQRSLEQPGRSPRHEKSNSTSILASPSRCSQQQVLTHKKAISISNPVLPPIPSTTPAGSPTSKLHHDGPLVASKSKLQSIMRSARGLFTSSAGVSAQAKMETLSPSSMRLRSQGQEVHSDLQLKNATGPSGLSQMMYPSLPNCSHTSIINTPSNESESRKTRGSTEKEEKRQEQEDKDRHRMEVDLDRAREQERQKAAKLKEQRSISATSTASTVTNVVQAVAQKVLQPVRQSPRRLQQRNEQHISMADTEYLTKKGEDDELLQSMGPPAAPPQKQALQAQKPKEMKRPIKPAKEIAPKPKPQPVAIRVGTLSQRIPLTNAALSSSLQDSLPPPQPRQNTIAKKSSNASIQTSTSTGLKSSTSSMPQKPKALLAAERKREQASY